MYNIWAAILVASALFHTAKADNSIGNSGSIPLTPRRFRAIPRPGRVADDFAPDPGPIIRLGDRPKPSPGDSLNLPKRPVSGAEGDGPDSPKDPDAYVPPTAPDLSQIPTKPSYTGLRGEADGTYHPCSPARFDDNLCMEVIGVGVDLLQELLPDPEDTSSSTLTRSQDAASRTTETGTAIPTPGSGFAFDARAAAMPNLNMSEWMSGAKYNEVYTAQELELLRDDPLCFFAVYERVYRAYASLELSSSSDTATASQPAPTSEDLSRRQIGCHNAPELCKSPEDKARTLYLGYLPDQIHLVYKYTPTEVTVKETGTTSCEGFTLEDQVTIPAFETTYGVFEYRAGQSPEPEPTEPGSAVDDNLVEDDAVRGKPFSLVAVLSSLFIVLLESFL